MSDDKKDGDPGDARKVPMYLGPYEAWNFGAGRGYALPVLRKYSKYYTALAELGAVPPGDPPPDPQQRDRAFFPTLWKDAPRHFIPFVVANPFDPAPTPDTLTKILRSGLYAAATSLPHVYMLLDKVKQSRFRVAFPVAKKAMHTDMALKPSDPEWRPDGGLRDRIGKDTRITVLAMIDDGLPFAHRNFRDESGKHTRVEFCWLQSIEIDQCQKSVLFGREYTRKQIEDFIAQHGDDEDTLYRAAGATADTEELGSLIDRHATHGAHVMDLATGYAPERGETPPEEIRIIAVQLPNTIAWDTSGFGKDMYMLSAFHYIFDRADIIANGYGVENLRLVINFSYGFSGGRHDGETELEAAINELVERRRCRDKCPSPTALVLPAGNTFLDRLHGLINPDDFVHDAATFYWRIQPNDRTPSYLELWFWKGFNPQGYEIELYDPWGELRSELKIEVPPPSAGQSQGDPNTIEPVQNAGHEQIGQISVDLHRASAKAAEYDTGRYRVLIVVAPTEPVDPCLPRADPGKWTIVVRRGLEARLIEQPIHCWIQRSADPESLRSGSRQSYFDDFNDIRYTLQGDLNEEDTEEAFVRRFGSLNGLATGRTSLIVAGYRLGAGLGSSLKKARPSRYSSAGALEPGWPDVYVDCSSMSDRSRVLTGTIAAGVRSGSLSFVQGTSAAAPFVARQLAMAFTTEDDQTVKNAETENYLSLLCGDSQQNGNESPANARLGAVRVPPDWQPGVDIDLIARTNRKGAGNR